MIHVAYRLGGGDGFYAKMLGTSMLSMFENTKEKVTVHVMHNDSLTPDNRGRFCYIAGQYNQKIEFHHAEKIAAEALKRIEEVYPTDDRVKRYTKAGWYSLIVHEVFPHLDKIIFLGADTIIDLDIAELWAYDLDDEYGFAAVPEITSRVKGAPRLINVMHVREKDYLNADVLLLKPKFFQENFERILEGCKFIRKIAAPYLDQDTLNYLFSEKYLKLPRKFNAMVTYLRKNPFIGKEIYHFAGRKPDLNTDDVYNRLYLEYFLKTPWANVDMFGNIDKYFKRFYNENKNTLLHFTNLLAERERVFFVDGNDVEAIRQIFAVRDSELLIDADDPNGGGKFLDALNESCGKKVVFILSVNYFAIRIALLQNGFVEGRDFVNGIMFLSEQYGVNLGFDSREIVQAM